MPRGDKSKYTNKEKRQAEHIEEGYEKRGLPRREAERRAWATVNKVHKGGEKPGGGGYGKPEDHSPMRKGGKLGGRGGVTTGGGSVRLGTQSRTNAKSPRTLALT